MKKIDYSNPQVKCPVGGGPIAKKQMKVHMRARKKVGSKWLCSCDPRHPGHRLLLYSKKLRGGSIMPSLPNGERTLK